jgi:mannitol/fructose-specific phosphotransferase system IIA component (Ntr-type)/predicted transcriptional regulator
VGEAAGGVDDAPELEDVEMVHRVKLDPRRVLLGVTATDRDALLRKMAAALLKAPGMPLDLGADALVSAVLEREREESTLIAEGLALPHARIPGVQGPRVCLAVLADPIDWNGMPVRIVVMMVGPMKQPGALLQVTSRLSRMLTDGPTRHLIESATDPVALAEWLQTNVQEEDAPILAEDVMRPALGLFSPEDPISELIRVMAQRNLDAAGVTDKDRKLVGQVSADDLFTLGVPDFFRQLKSVSFIAEFDPFERYLDREHKLLVRDVMNADYAKVPPTATALEVVFLLSVKRYPKVFVVDAEDHLLGVIDRIRMIDRVFNL